ncbi:MAG: LuxR C-terminal-related transcriptional regulator [Patescibacteria group bacterium]|nr:LuxR C-terminal-related transcriptional regulator [Patescibacteria group bacterium]
MSEKLKPSQVAARRGQEQLRTVGEFTPPPGWFADDFTQYAREDSAEYGNLFRGALSLYKNAEQAREAVQNTLARAWESHGQFKQGSHMAAWLYTILRNNFLDEKRREKTAALYNTLENNLMGEHGALESTPEEAVYAKQIAEQIDKLPPDMRAAVLAVHRSGSFKDAAKETGMSPERIRELLEITKGIITSRDGEGDRIEIQRPPDKKKFEDFMSRQDIERYLPRLQQKSRDAYTKVVLEGKTYSNATKELGISEGTLKSRLFRARQKLSELTGVLIDAVTKESSLRSWYEARPESFRNAIKRSGLSPRQTDVINLIMEGNGSAEIADKLGVKLLSARSYIQHVYDKISPHLE